MIVWKGLGFLVPLFVFVSLFLVQAVVNSVQGDPSYYTTQDWPKVLGFIFAAILIFVLDKFVLSSGVSREVMDTKTGQKMLLKKEHSFFFISMKYWVFALPVVGVLFVFLR